MWRFFWGLSVMLAMLSAPIASLAEDELPAFSGATEWLNSKPLTARGLRGKVVLVEVMTYTCVNWLRTLPYVRAWAAKYKDHGLVVIGVQSPEFSFEHDVAGVRRALAEMRIDYPIAVDNDFAIWRSLNNEYWPALYFADAQGRIQHHQFGEGDYENSERIIQKLLAQAGGVGIPNDLVAIEPTGAEAGADLNDLQSPESYVGYGQAINFSSPRGIGMDRRPLYAAPAQLQLNHWGLSGDWTVAQEAVISNEIGDRIMFRFHARDLNIVMRPEVRGKPVRYRILVDGHPPGNAGGADVDARGYGNVSEPRLYQLIRGPKPIVDRTFEIEFLDSGVAAYVFTFG
jgi:hypothetical protein